MTDEPHDCEWCHVTHDCDDCGTLHTNWSDQQRYADEMAERWPDVLLVVTQLTACLDGVDEWTARAAITHMYRQAVDQ